MLRRDQGFTMIELLLVLLGAVLFASMGLFAHRGMSRMQLATTAREIQSLIRGAQNRAYGERGIHHVAFYQSEQECCHVQESRVVNKVKMPKGIKMELTNFPGGKLYFSRKLNPSGGGTIKLTSKTHQVDITVLPVTGRVKIYPIARYDMGR